MIEINSTPAPARSGIDRLDYPWGFLAAGSKANLIKAALARAGWFLENGELTPMRWRRVPSETAGAQIHLAQVTRRRFAVWVRYATNRTTDEPARRNPGTCGCLARARPSRPSSIAISYERRAS